jgi:hypothetical protein
MLTACDQGFLRWLTREEIDWCVDLVSLVAVSWREGQNSNSQSSTATASSSMRLPSPVSVQVDCEYLGQEGVD